MGVSSFNFYIFSHHLPHPFPSLALFTLQNRFRRSGKNYLAAVCTAALPHFDYVIRLGDEFEAVFDDDDRVSVGDEFSEQGKKFFGILAVKAGGRLVENIERTLFVKFARKFYALDFAARKSGCGSPERYVTDADLSERSLLFFPHSRLKFAAAPSPTKRESPRARTVKG